MSMFSDRQKSFEDKYAHDSETRFKIEARRNKLFGLWLASERGLAGEAAQSYSKEIVLSDLEKPGYDDLIDKAYLDCQNSGLSLSKESLVQKLLSFTEEAEKSISSK